MRHALYRMEREEAIAILAAAPTFHLAAALEDGTPVLRTFNGVVVDGALAFHGAPVGEKVGMLGRMAVASVEELVASIPSYFVDPSDACRATSYYRSVQVQGLIEPVEDLEEKARILNALMAKYQPEGRYDPLTMESPRAMEALGRVLICRMSLDNLSGKAKLGQNRKPAELVGVIEGLWARGLEGDPLAIDLIRAANPGHLVPDFLQSPVGTRLLCAMGEEEVEAAAELLSLAYWNTDRTKEQLARAQLGSPAWVGAKDEQGCLIATARAISDGSKYAWVYDVMVAPDWQGKGLGKTLMRLLLDHPRVRDSSAVFLSTRDAQGLYAKFGFMDRALLPPKPYPSAEMILQRKADASPWRQRGWESQERTPCGRES